MYLIDAENKRRNTNIEMTEYLMTSWERAAVASKLAESSMPNLKNEKYYLTHLFKVVYLHREKSLHLG